MTFIPPEQCAWYQSCVPYTNCKEAGKCVVAHLSDGPTGNSHDINTDYHIVVAGVVIPLVRTVRKFGATYGTTYGQPSDIKYFRADADVYAFECSKRPPDARTLTVSDDCVIEKSTLHYLDQRYGVCLYRYQKDELHMTVDSGEMAQIKEPWQIGNYHQAQVKTSSYTSKSTEEWRLIVDGVERVLSSVVTELSPFGPRNNGLPSGTGLFPDYAPDPETRLVLLYPTPPSQGIPWSDVICRLGAYEFGYDTPEGAESAQNQSDGGEKDHFYPEWCRNLQEDPFWRAAADRRYQISWWKSDLANPSAGYIPPPISVDPIPRGSFARHPDLGTAYQFLLGLSGGGNHLETSPNLNDLIDLALPVDGKTHDTTLYYPISLI